MFTQEEFENAYEIISGFDYIRKQINDDPKLLNKLSDVYKSEGYDIKGSSDVNKLIKGDPLFCFVLLYFFRLSS